MSLNNSGGGSGGKTIGCKMVGGPGIPLVVVADMEDLLAVMVVFSVLDPQDLELMDLVEGGEGYYSGSGGGRWDNDWDYGGYFGGGGWWIFIYGVFQIHCKCK